MKPLLEGGSTSSGSPLPASVSLAKRSLEQETDMTDASVEQGERKRCKEHPTVLESADSSSSTESSTDTEIGSVDVCAIPSENPERRLPSRWTRNARCDSQTCVSLLRQNSHNIVRLFRSWISCG